MAVDSEDLRKIGGVSALIGAYLLTNNQVATLIAYGQITYGTIGLVLLVLGIYWFLNNS